MNTNGPVICGIDESGTASRAVLVARELASQFDSDLIVVHVVPDGGSAQLERPPEFGAPIADSIVEHGHPADRLLAVAQERQASFLVVGCHGPRSSLLGSISADVARRAPCPVVTVPPTASTVALDRGEAGVSVAGGFVRFTLGRAAASAR